MSLTAGDQAAIIAVGAAVLLGIATAIVKAVNIRGDSNDKWSSRIDLAAGALDEKTVAELAILRTEIDSVLPDPDAPFEPAQAIVDPSPLSARVEKTAKYYRARIRLKKDLDRVLRMGRMFVAGLVILAIGVVLLTTYFAELLNWPWARPVGFGFGGLGALTLVLAMAIYGVCVDRLAGAEILADTAGRSGKGSSE